MQDAPRARSEIGNELGMAASALTSGSAFWLIVGTMSGVAASLAIGTLWRSAASRANAWRMRTALVTSAVVFVGGAIALYLALGSPEAVSTSIAAAPAHEHSDATSGRAATSMEAAITNLRERLARGGGSDADWELLAQSYQFNGDEAAAALARKHQLPQLATVVPTTTSDSWETVAATARREHKYAEAREAFEHLIQLGQMSADSWANYADVLASLGGGKLSGPPAAAIEHALALDGTHPKALWLEASLAHEEHREADALGVWRKLRSILPDGSSDAAIVDANIAEASELAGARAAPLPQTSTVAAVLGQVSISPELAKQATPGSTLFIYAKSVDSPGPPLAVFRSAVKAWPVSFRLDDSMAMMPSRTVSSAKTVIVEARISRTGQATPAAGDLQATGITTDPRAGKPIQLTISKVIG